MGKSFLARYNNPLLRVDSMLDAESHEVAKLNKLDMKSIVEWIIYCGKQAISFRGHRDYPTADTLYCSLEPRQMQFFTKFFRMCPPQNATTYY